MYARVYTSHPKPTEVFTMKYNAKQTTTGKWVVAKGNRPISKAYETKAEAHEQAILESMFWHKEQDRKLWLMLSKGEEFATFLDGSVNDHCDFFV